MFAEILEQYSQGKITYEDIKEALSSTLTSSPEMHANVTNLLNSEQAKALLTSVQQQELLGLVYEITQSGDDGKTRIVGQPATAEPEPEPETETETETEQTTSNGQAPDSTVLEKTQIAPPDAADHSSGNKSPGQLKPGDTIKGRFVLEELIGQGGMGIVFKARDLRKEEAMDRNPHVAIKVLGEAFKDHPQALIALQRESRKAQTLAHPNIATVFDFDRDGEIVYMTMEHLEGDPLDKLIKKHYPNPFEKEQALHIIDGICAGMAYAHSNNIIHSDLKPGNVYVTKNNTVKIFDFGIARAMKKKEGDHEVDELSGETTLFDAGDLGGLTPAYASYEMLTGQEPDVRDDIYALACISYELLGGKHPFNKIPANQAKSRNLSPPSVANLSRKQVRVLTQGLSFDRQLRTASVIKFQEGLCGKTNLSKGLIGATVVASIAALAIASIPVMNYLDDQEIASIVSELNSGDEQTILATLATIETLNDKLKEGALAGGKDALIRYFEKKVEQETDTDKGKYNFSDASRLLEEAKKYYPDSAQLESVISRINSRKNTLLNEVTTRFNRNIDEEKLIPKAKSDDLIDTLAEVAMIDKNHPLLRDPRISIAYTQAAQKAAKANNLHYAEQLVTTGLALLPADVSLINMQDAIEAAKTETGDTASQLAMLQQSLEKSIAPAQRKQTITTLLKTPFKDRQWSTMLAAQFSYLKETVGTDDAWVVEHNQIIRDTYLSQAQKMRKAARYSEASNIIRTAKTIIPSTPALLSEEKQIITAKMEYEKEQKKAAETAHIEGTKQTLLTQAKANDVKGAKQNFNKLRKLLPTSNVFISAEAPKAIADAYLRLAQSSARRRDFRSATDLVKAGLEISPNQTTLQQALESYQAKLPKGSSSLVSSSDDPCKVNYAGHGKRSRATCSDVLDKNSKGPLMIVIPAGSSIAKPFAITKYEISVADYNLFCKLSNSCTTKPGQSDLPLTDISFSEAQQYSEWLSKTSGYSYRIPADAEWLHAAKADGQQPEKDFNCQVSLGGNLLKGQALLSTRTGKSNGWGLTNYVGNAQEWVLTEQSKLKARGGAYKDPLSKCDISLSRNHNGAQDNITGFRLVRELKLGS